MRRRSLMDASSNGAPNARHSFPSLYVSSSYMSTVRKNRKRSRKRPIPPQTTRDQMRRLVETNQMTARSNNFNPQGLLLVAQSRLDFVRNRLYQYWNPDLPPPPNRVGTTTTAAIPPTSLRHKQGPIMDGYWWMVNIGFALLPAVIIGVYCEVWGQYDMYEYHLQQEVQQWQKLHPNDIDTPIESLIAAGVLPAPPQHFGIRAQKFAWELYRLLTMLFSDKEEREEPPQDGEEVKKHPKHQHQRGLNNTEASTGPPLGRTGDSQTEESPPLQEIWRRLERLEQQQNRLGAGSFKPGTNQEQLQRTVHQSGIQNRMEEARTEQWRHKLSDYTGEQKSKQEPSLISHKNQTETDTVPKQTHGTWWQTLVDSAHNKLPNWTTSSTSPPQPTNGNSPPGTAISTSGTATSAAVTHQKQSHDEKENSGTTKEESTRFTALLKRWWK